MNIGLASVTVVTRDTQHNVTAMVAAIDLLKLVGTEAYNGIVDLVYETRGR